MNGYGTSLGTASNYLEIAELLRLSYCCNIIPDGGNIDIINIVIIQKVVDGKEVGRLPWDAQSFYQRATGTIHLHLWRGIRLDRHPQ